MSRPKPHLLVLSIALLAGCARGGLPAGSLTEKQLPAGLLAGLSDGQKHEVLLAMNEEQTRCAGARTSWARALVAEPSCPRSGSVFKQAVELAKLGQRAAEIRAAIRAAPTSATAPIARERVHADGCKAEGEPTETPQAGNDVVHDSLARQGKN